MIEASRHTLAAYVGIPYEPRGMMPACADCYTLIRHYAEMVLGQHWPEYCYDIPTYCEEATDHIMMELSHPGDRWLPVDYPQHGDLLVFRLLGHPVHVGLYLGEGLFLHTLKGRASCIEPLSRWQQNHIATVRWSEHAN